MKGAGRPTISLLPAVLLTATLLLPASMARAESNPTHPADADGPQPALSVDDFTRLDARLRSLNRRSIAAAFARGDGGAERCEFSTRDVECRCLHLADGMPGLQIDRWRVADGETLVEGLVATGSTGRVRLTARRARLTDKRVVLREVVVVGAQEVLTAERAELSDKQQVLVEPRWWPGTGRPPAAPPCRSTASTVTPEGTPVMAANRAVHRAGAWHFRGLRRPGSPPIGLGDPTMTAGRPVSGLLPTSGRFDGAVGEFLQRYIVWPGGLGPLVTVAPGAWYGAGVSLATRAERERPAELLDAEVRWDARRREVGWSVVGELHRGGERVHLAADLEEVSRADYWGTARLDRPGLLRSWRRSRLGVSLSGEAHDLQVRLGHWSDSPWTAGEEFEVRLRYGSDWAVGEGWEASIEVVHRDAVRQSARDHHGSVVLGEFLGLIGERRRLWGDAGVVASLGNRIVSSNALDDLESGFDARGTTQLVGFARGGLTLQGDLGASGYHRIEPSIALFREIVGAGSASGVAFDRTPPPRVPRWTALAAGVEQTFSFDGGRVTWPVGLLVDGAGLAALGDRPALLTSRLDGRVGATQASIGAVTDTRFGRFAYHAGVAWLLERAEIYLESTSLTVAETPALYLNDITGDAAGSLRLLQPLAAGAVGDDGTRRLHTAGVDWRLADHRLRTEYFMSEAFVRNGLRGGWTWRWPELGWGVGLSGMYETSRGAWGVSAGLRTGR